MRDGYRAFSNLRPRTARAIAKALLSRVILCNPVPAARSISVSRRPPFSFGLVLLSAPRERANTNFKKEDKMKTCTNNTTPTREKHLARTFTPASLSALLLILSKASGHGPNHGTLTSRRKDYPALAAQRHAVFWYPYSDALVLCDGRRLCRHDLDDVSPIHGVGRASAQRRKRLPCGVCQFHHPQGNR